MATLKTQWQIKVAMKGRDWQWDIKSQIAWILILDLVWTSYVALGMVLNWLGFNQLSWYWKYMSVCPFVIFLRRYNMFSTEESYGSPVLLQILFNYDSYKIQSLLTFSVTYFLCDFAVCVLREGRKVLIFKGRCQSKIPLKPI